MHFENSLFQFCFITVSCFAFILFLYIYVKRRKAQVKLSQKLIWYRVQELERKDNKDAVLFIKKNKNQIESHLGEFLSNKIILPKFIKVFIKNKDLNYVTAIPLFVLSWLIATLLIIVMTKFHILQSGVSGFFVCIILSYYSLDYLDKLQERKFLKIFPHTLDIISRGLKAGITIEKTFHTVAREIEEPVRGEFQYILDQISFGVPFEQALRNSVDRFPYNGFHFFVSVLILQRKTGGSAAELIAEIARVLRSQQALQDKIRALSAEAKTTGWIVGSLPVLAFTGITFMQPQYLEIFQNDPFGRKLLMLAGGLLVASVITIKKIINFKDY